MTNAGFTYKDWNIEAITGYKPITTFYMDFSIADRFGIAAVRDTYRRAMRGWKKNYKYLTELVMALNWKIWEHHNAGHSAYAQLYNDLWEQAATYAQENLKGDELKYYYRTTD